MLAATRLGFLTGIEVPLPLIRVVLEVIDSISAFGFREITSKRVIVLVLTSLLNNNSLLVVRQLEDNVFELVGTPSEFKGLVG